MGIYQSHENSIIECDISIILELFFQFATYLSEKWIID